MKKPIQLSKREVVTIVLAFRALKVAQEGGQFPAPPPGVPPAFEGLSLDALSERFMALLAKL